MKINVLNKQDIPELLELRLEQQKEYHECLNEEEKNILEYTKQYLEECLNKELYMFGAYIQDELIAICGYNVWNSFPTMENHTGKMAYLCSAYTKREYRGQGIMNELVSNSIKEIQKQGITKIKLNTKKENAVRIYTKLGFVKDETAMVLNV